MPSRLTLVQIEGMLARDEAQPEACRYAGMEAEARNRPHLSLARLVEERADLLRRARALRLAR